MQIHQTSADRKSLKLFQVTGLFLIDFPLPACGNGKMPMGTEISVKVQFDNIKITYIQLSFKSYISRMFFQMLFAILQPQQRGKKR